MSKSDDIYVYGEVYLKEDQIFDNTALNVTLIDINSKKVLEQQRIQLKRNGEDQAIDFKMHFDPVSVDKTEEYAIYAEINSLTHFTHTARQYYPVDLNNKTASASVFMNYNPRAIS